MNILVTGGAGFIASHVADGFIDQGHSVTILDNLSMGKLANLNPDAKFFLMDIRAQELAKVFEQGQFDVVCHHAAQMDVRVSVKDPTFDADVNILGTLNLLQNCIDFNVDKFMFASTGGAIYGEQDVFPCDEAHPTRPVSPYGISKLVVEKYLYYYAVEYGLKYEILRYANIYGPRQNAKGEAGVVAIFCDRLLKGDQPIINGAGKQTRDYVYVGDVVQANLLALNHTENNIFNIGTGIESDVNILFQHLNKMTGGKAQEKHGPAKPGEQQRSVISSAHIESVLGWTPKVKLADGLQKTVDYFKSQNG